TRLANFRVKVYKNHPDLSTGQTCYFQRGSVGAFLRRNCSTLLRGRYLKISKDTELLTLCEVEVMAIS
ncbi:hypothetical protein BaRGS_00011243, partial [Batillaria attramentaria]